jgi:hypothetical protein
MVVPVSYLYLLDDGLERGVLDRPELIDFVRARGLGVIASRGPDGSPQAALVGIAATDEGELVLDCSRGSRKYANIESDPAVAVVVGWDDEVTVQVEGSAQILGGADLERCKVAYFEQYPGGQERAASPEIARTSASSRGGCATPTTAPTRSAAPRRSSDRTVGRSPPGHDPLGETNHRVAPRRARVGQVRRSRFVERDGVVVWARASTRVAERGTGERKVDSGAPVRRGPSVDVGARHRPSARNARALAGPTDRRRSAGAVTWPSPWPERSWTLGAM